MMNIRDYVVLDLEVGRLLGQRAWKQSLGYSDLVSVVDSWRGKM